MKLTQCEYCGDDLNGSVDKCQREPVTCGKPECDRWAREVVREAHEEAHDQLERDMGWKP